MRSIKKSNNFFDFINHKVDISTTTIILNYCEDHKFIFKSSSNTKKGKNSKE